MTEVIVTTTPTTPTTPTARKAPAMSNNTTTATTTQKASPAMSNDTTTETPAPAATKAKRATTTKAKRAANKGKRAATKAKSSSEVKPASITSAISRRVAAALADPNLTPLTTYKDLVRKSDINAMATALYAGEAVRIPTIAYVLQASSKATAKTFPLAAWTLFLAGEADKMCDGPANSQSSKQRPAISWLASFASNAFGQGPMKSPQLGLVNADGSPMQWRNNGAMLTHGMWGVVSRTHGTMTIDGRTTPCVTISIDVDNLARWQALAVDHGRDAAALVAQAEAFLASDAGDERQRGEAERIIRKYPPAAKARQAAVSAAVAHRAMLAERETARIAKAAQSAKSSATTTKAEK